MELSKLCQIVAITKVHPRSVQRAPMTVVFPGLVSFSSLPQAYPPRILQILAQRAHQIPVLLAARLASLVKSAWLCFCLREHCSCCHTLLHRPQACAFFAASCRSEERLTTVASMAPTTLVTVEGKAVWTRVVFCTVVTRVRR